MGTETTASLHRFSASPVRRAVVAADGIRLSLLEWGDPGRPTAILLHGGGLNAHSWDVVCDLMCTDYHCLAVDLRGHGDSDWSVDGRYDLDDYVADLATVTTQHGLGSFALIGMSLGGHVALAAAARHPERVKAVILVDSGPHIRSIGSARIRNFMLGSENEDSIDAFIDRAIAFNPRRTREQLKRSIENNIRQGSDGKWQWKYDRRRLTSTDGEPARQEKEDRLWSLARSVDAPTLIVRGGLSDVFLDEDAEALGRAMRNAVWVRVDDAGHSVQGDAPYALARLIRSFLSGDGDAPRGPS